MPPISSDETLARYITSRHWIQKKNNTIKHAAFMPYNGEVSVYRISFITEDEVWEIGKSITENQDPPKTLRGRADLISEKVITLGLTVNPSEPPRHHANISDYPSEESEIKLIALELASQSQFKGTL